MKLSYLLTCKNEPEFRGLLSFIFQYKDKEDEVVILSDGHSLDEVFKEYPAAKVVYHDLGHSYSEHRNAALSSCDGDFILALDADEMPTALLMSKIKQLLYCSNYPEILLLPRLNRVGDKSGIAWPDYQTRLFKNKVDIQWVGNVHERLNLLPEQRAILLTADEKLAILHTKTKEKQETNTKRYLSKYTPQENQGTYRGPL